MSTVSSVHTASGLLDNCSEVSDDFNVNDGAAVPNHWEGDTDFCGVCSSKLGVMRRHHCRLCGACVCGTCSPSLVQVEGHRKPQRACTPCVAGAQVVPIVKKRLTRLSTHLREMGGVGNVPEWAVAEAGSLMEATALCEEALLPVDQALASAKALADCAEAEAATERKVRQDIQAEAVSTKEILVKLNQRLGGCGPPCPKVLPNNVTREEFRPGTLKEIALACEAATLENNDPRRTPRGWRRDLQKRSKSAGESVDSTSWFRQDGDQRGRESAQKIAWTANTSNCEVCGTKIGKRHLNRRHHCRLCGRCVCAGCSPSCMTLEDIGQKKKQPQRVCTPCASGASNATTLSRRLELIATRIQALSHNYIPPPSPANVEQALNMCEAALEPLEDMCNKAETA